MVAEIIVIIDQNPRRMPPVLQDIQQELSISAASSKYKITRS